jgi:hypothetical protein
VKGRVFEFVAAPTQFLINRSVGLDVDEAFATPDSHLASCRIGIIEIVAQESVKRFPVLFFLKKKQEVLESVRRVFASPELYLITVIVFIKREMSVSSPDVLVNIFLRNRVI